MKTLYRLASLFFALASAAAMAIAVIAVKDLTLCAVLVLTSMVLARWSWTDYEISRLIRPTLQDSVKRNLSKPQRFL
jgi:hypothetical protein